MSHLSRVPRSGSMHSTPDRHEIDVVVDLVLGSALVRKQQRHIGVQEQSTGHAAKYEFS